MTAARAGVVLAAGGLRLEERFEWVARAEQGVEVVEQACGFMDSEPQRLSTLFCPDGCGPQLVLWVRGSTGTSHLVRRLVRMG